MWSCLIREQRYSAPQIMAELVTQVKGHRRMVSISNAAACVVGEAHGFSYTYLKKDGKDWLTDSCETCEEFAVQFDLYSSNWKYQNVEHLKEDFVDHWNREHV
jgi:hypothetical protein